MRKPSIVLMIVVALLLTGCGKRFPYVPKMPSLEDNASKVKSRASACIWLLQILRA